MGNRIFSLLESMGALKSTMVSVSSEWASSRTANMILIQAKDVFMQVELARDEASAWVADLVGMDHEDAQEAGVKILEKLSFDSFTN